MSPGQGSIRVVGARPRAERPAAGGRADAAAGADRGHRRRCRTRPRPRSRRRTRPTPSCGRGPRTSSTAASARRSARSGRRSPATASPPTSTRAREPGRITITPHVDSLPPDLQQRLTDSIELVRPAGVVVVVGTPQPPRKVDLELRLTTAAGLLAQDLRAAQRSVKDGIADFFTRLPAKDPGEHQPARRDRARRERRPGRQARERDLDDERRPAARACSTRRRAARHRRLPGRRSASCTSPTRTCRRR